MSRGYISGRSRPYSRRSRLERRIRTIGIAVAFLLLAFSAIELANYSRSASPAPRQPSPVPAAALPNRPQTVAVAAQPG